MRYTAKKLNCHSRPASVSSHLLPAIPGGGVSSTLRGPQAQARHNTSSGNLHVPETFLQATPLRLPDDLTIAGKTSTSYVHFIGVRRKRLHRNLIYQYKSSYVPLKIQITTAAVMCYAARKTLL
ncbi:Hypothetical protein SMAX5B_005248 [Scophthalmus maximus]|uniref:Uncharacterized protein n=1 Tax=Scophthalmus maximus TaxID=52904 RepID=A0A2U9CH34_SCOMX|nr:Hypothetical protein SMAX5B_005248 [Scophthalmus maximus]